jgi:hypothetical protein
MKATLKRTYGQKQTIGVLTFVDEKGINQTFATLEKPWISNNRNVSCIPEGVYKVSRHYSPTFKECFHVQSVPGRSEILIHPGNFVENSRGCILVGMKHVDLNKDGIIDISSSKMAMTLLLKLLPQQFDLTITV